MDKIGEVAGLIAFILGVLCATLSFIMVACPNESYLKPFNFYKLFNILKWIVFLFFINLSLCCVLFDGHLMDI
jgi:hypothetical protein